MTDILAKDFETRQRLETKVASSIGLTADPKPQHLIKGTKHELKKLHLSHGSSFWGIRVEQSDAPAKQEKIEKAERGKIHKSPKERDLDITNSKEA